MIKISKKLLVAGVSIALLASSGFAGTTNIHAQSTQSTQRVANQYHGNVPKWKQVGTAGYTLALQQHDQQVRAQQEKEAKANQSNKEPVINDQKANNTKPVYITQKSSLPQTGESSNHTGLIASALASIGALFGVMSLRKRNQN